MRKKEKITFICSLLLLLVLTVTVTVTLIWKHDPRSDETASETVSNGSGDAEKVESADHSYEPDSDPVGEPAESTDADIPGEPHETQIEEATSLEEPATEEVSSSEEEETSTPSKEPEALAYDTYMSLSSEEQEAYFNSFSSVEAFFKWYNAAKQQYIDEHPGIEIGPDGVIPLP